MTKVFLFMWMCSSVPGNECIKIPTPEFSFNDLYDCTVYGYAHSEDIIVSLTRDFVNEKQVFTKFSCNFQEIV
tara:strand:- start:22 stop:240 length:219 start_codon:yes stop_codon:yes gene_type:complete